MLNKNEKRLASVINEITGNADNLKEEGAKNALKILDRARRETKTALAEVGGDTWEAYHLPRLQRAIDRATLNFGNKYKQQLASDMDDLWEMGQMLVDSPLKTMGVSTQVPELNIRALEVAKSSMERLIDRKGKGIVVNLSDGIKKAVTQGITGQLTPKQIMDAIGNNLTDAGPFKSIAVRAEITARTEIAHIQNKATSLRMRQSGRNIPGMNHQWLWSGIGRITHAVANGQIKQIGEPFWVGGEQMMYPLDPAASAENVIACGCSEVVHMEGWPTLKELNPKLHEKARRFTQEHKMAASQAGSTGDHMTLAECYGVLLIDRMAA